MSVRVWGSVPDEYTVSTHAHPVSWVLHSLARKQPSGTQYFQHGFLNTTSISGWERGLGSFCCVGLSGKEHSLGPSPLAHAGRFKVREKGKQKREENGKEKKPAPVFTQGGCVLMQAPPLLQCR